MFHPPRRAFARSARSLLISSAAAVGLTLASVSGAHAATTTLSTYVTTYPADFEWDGSGTFNAGVYDTGDWDVEVSQDRTNLPPGATPLCGAPTSSDSSPSCKATHLRGGVEVPTRTPDKTASIPVAVLPGDVLQLANSTGGVVQSFTVPAPQPVIASQLGPNNATIAKTAGANIVSVQLYRRVARQVQHDTNVPGTYEWRQVLTKDQKPDVSADTCSYFDSSLQKSVDVTDTLPPHPTAAPDTGKVWELFQTSECTDKYVPTPATPYELVSYGQTVAVTPTAYTVNFGTPLLAGDVIGYSDESDTFANDTENDVSVRNYAAVGVIPPPDVTAPKAPTFDFGASKTTIKSFTKSGFLVFVSLDEPGTVTEQLMLTPKAKKAKKTKGKHKKKAKKVIPVPVLIGSGTGTVAAAGQTAKVNVVVTPAGRKLLKSLDGKPAKATLVTTLKDAVGNTTTTSAPYSLSAK